MRAPRVRFKLWWLMAAVAVAAILLYKFAVPIVEARRERWEHERAVPHFMNWLQRSLPSDGSLTLQSGQIYGYGPPSSPCSEGEFWLVTRRGGKILITVMICDGPGRKTQRVGVSSKSRMVGVSPEDVEAERATDFRALMPEAFR